MILYGIGKNYGTLKSYGLLPYDDKVLLVDKNKCGNVYDGRVIHGIEAIKERPFDTIWVLPSCSEDIVENLTADLKIDKERIKTTPFINSQIVLGNLDPYKYVMITTDSDYLNFPYMSLLNSNDFTMRPILDQVNGGFFSANVGESTKKHVFIVRDHCFIKLQQYGLINYLKSIYDKSFWVVIMSDMCGGEFGRLETFGYDYLNRLKAEFDVVLTYHRGDAQKYGLVYYEQTYPQISYKDRIMYDVLFVGNSKNRLELLHSTYRRLTEQGVSCRFFINNVNDGDQLPNAEIVYNTPLPYDAYLHEVAKSKCILEICQKGDETTYRYAEAIMNNKKLLVNDSSCVTRKYYNSNFMMCFDNPEDIDPNWIKNEITVNYHYENDFSPSNFLGFIEKCIENRGN